MPLARAAADPARRAGTGARRSRAVAALGVAVAALRRARRAGRPRRAGRVDRAPPAYAYGQVSRIPAELADQRAFARAAGARPAARDAPADRLLTGLRGKDVLFVFVESYGRVAVAGLVVLAGRRRRAGRRRPGGSAPPGSRARSAFLTSPTFGAISWLAHSTLQSGLWVDSQQRYDLLVTSAAADAEPAPSAGRLAHRRRRAGQHARLAAGRRSTATTSSTTPATSGTPGRGSATRRCPTSTPSPPSTGSSSRRGTAPPVMAEIDLVSSHAPWSRTPHDWSTWATVGDGSVFDGMPEQAPSQDGRSGGRRDRVRAAYGQSIEYSLRRADLLRARPTATTDLVLVVLGDHQPAHRSSPATDAGHDVPVTVVAARPGRAGPDLRLGLAATGCGPARTRRSGGWTPSATGSSPRSAQTPVTRRRPAGAH